MAQIECAYPSLVKLCHPDLFVSGSAAAAAAEKRMKANQHPTQGGV